MCVIKVTKMCFHLIIYSALNLTIITVSNRKSQKMNIQNQSNSVRVDFTGQQSSCMVATSWMPYATTIGSNKIQILRLLDRNQIPHYVSVNSSGISPRSSKFLRINGNFGLRLNLKDKDEITVSEVTIIPLTIKSAMVSCVSYDDWEILEANSEVLTNSLLYQLRIVYVGLKFPFWVTKSVKIHLNIDKVEPEAEFGILDSSSEIIIPSLKTSLKPTISLTGMPRVRLHPVILFKTELNFCVPSISLLLNNTRHAFAYKAFLCNLTNSDDNESNSHFFAKFFEDKTTNSGADPGIMKVFLLDNLDINEQILRRSFPLTNPPCLYVHPKLLENHQNSFLLKSSKLLEQVNESEFVQVENQYVTINPRDEEKVIPTGTKFVGFDRLFQDGCQFLKAALSLEDVQHNFIGPTFGNLLITGREGSGKSALAHRLVEQFSNHPYFVHFEIILCPKLRGKKSESVEKHFNDVLAKAIKLQPALIILDDLDFLLPTLRAEQQNLAEEFQCLRMSETLIDCVMQLEGQQIVFIAIAKATDSLNPYWKSRQGFHFFHKCIHIPPPNQLERLEIFQKCIQPYLHCSDPNPYIEGTISTSELLSPVGNNEELGSGLYTLSESMKVSLSTIHDEFASPQLIRRVAEKWALNLFETLESTKNHSSKDDTCFQQIIDKELINFGGVSSESSTVKVTWKQIGGLNEVKRELTKILEWPIKYPKLFENCPVKLPSGILLYGYPGSGKTLLALGVPSIVNAKFIHIKGPELLSKYIGASEQSVKDLFQRAKDSKPCILFFDEFDSLVPRRGHDSTGVTDRVVNQFLAEMDGVDGGMGQGVHLIAATSRPDLIDPAILRPGRLDKHLFFDMPTEAERIEIVKRQSEQVNLSLWNDEDWNLIGRETEGFTGADLHSLLFSAQMDSIQQYLGKLESNESTPGRNEISQMEKHGHVEFKGNVVITMDNMGNSLANFHPSLQGKELQKFQIIYDDFSSSRKVGSSGKEGSKLISKSEKRATLA